MRDGSGLTSPRLVKTSDPNYQEIVFKRARSQIRLKAGDYVKVRGTSKQVRIKEIYDDIIDVVWEKNRPHFIVVETNDGKTLVANPSQLKGKNK